MIDQRFTRNSEMMDGLKDKSVAILGLGSIGSLASLCLAKNGFINQAIYDMDTVDINNIGPQIYGPKQIDKPKQEAMKTVVNTLVGENSIDTFYWKIGDDFSVDTMFYRNIEYYSNAVIIAVDCMDIRKKILEGLKRADYSGIVIDARMSISYLQLYSFKMDYNEDIGIDTTKPYASTLFNNSEAIQTPCTDKATAFTSFIAGGMITKELIMRFKNYSETKTRSISYDILNDDLFVSEVTA